MNERNPWSKVMATDPQERAFLIAIDQNRMDELSRLAYADWLEEHDRVEEAYRQRHYCNSYKWLRDFALNHHAYGEYLKEDIEKGLDPQEGDGSNEERLEEYTLQILYFLESHISGNRSFGFDLPDMEDSDYTDELWNHFEIITGKKAPEQNSKGRTGNLPFHCAC